MILFSLGIYIYQCIAYPICNHVVIFCDVETTWAFIEEMGMSMTCYVCASSLLFWL